MSEILVSIINVMASGTDAVNTELRRVGDIAVEIVTVAKSRCGSRNPLREGFLHSNGKYISYNKELALSNIETLRNSDDDCLTISPGSSLEDVLRLHLQQPYSVLLQHTIFHRHLYERSGGYCSSDCSDYQDNILPMVLLSTAQSCKLLSTNETQNDLRYKRIDSAGADKLVASIQWLEAYYRRHGLIEKYGREIDRRKMMAKYSILKGVDKSRLKKYTSIFKETSPAVLEGTDVNALWRMALMGSRSGHSLFLRLARLLYRCNHILLTFK